MKFKYIENDPMDMVPINAGKMVISFAGCLLYLALYLIMWCAIYGWRP